jgi:hypothetical protein
MGSDGIHASTPCSGSGEFTLLEPLLLKAFAASGPSQSTPR